MTLRAKIRSTDLILLPWIQGEECSAPTCGRLLGDTLCIDLSLGVDARRINELCMILESHNLSRELSMAISTTAFGLRIEMLKIAIPAAYDLMFLQVLDLRCLYLEPIIVAVRSTEYYYCVSFLISLLTVAKCNRMTSTRASREDR